MVNSSLFKSEDDRIQLGDNNIVIVLWKKMHQRLLQLLKVYLCTCYDKKLQWSIFAIDGLGTLTSENIDRTMRASTHLSSVLFDLPLKINISSNRYVIVYASTYATQNINIFYEYVSRYSAERHTDRCRPVTEWHHYFVSSRNNYYICHRSPSCCIHTYTGALTWRKTVADVEICYLFIRDAVV